jgi:hypothetical protein
VRERALILAGLVGFLAAVTWPAWSARASHPVSDGPVLVRPVGETKCVAPTDVMRRTHMRLLADWRDSVVRTGVRMMTTNDGRQFRMSLTGTCLGCHQKAGFCDRCHAYVSVKPACWECHVAGKESR